MGESLCDSSTETNTFMLKAKDKIDGGISDLLNVKYLMFLKEGKNICGDVEWQRKM